MLIGAHVSGRGRGLPGMLDAARALGAEAVQAFGSNPRGWAPPVVPDPAAAGDLRAAWRAGGGPPLFLHSPYPVNVASPSAEFRRRSAALVRATLGLGEALGARGVVVHAGSGGPDADRDEAVRRAARTLLPVAGTARGARPLVELTAGTAGSVAATLPEARALFDACGGDPRLALCLDTCHLFAAGYALDTHEGAARLAGELAELGLDDRLGLVHANDARGGRGSHLDRHANIGEGGIGLAGFRALLAQPALRRVPWVIETPGTDEVRARDVATLRALAAGEGGAQGSSSAPGPS